MAMKRTGSLNYGSLLHPPFNSSRIILNRIGTHIKGLYIDILPFPIKKLLRGSYVIVAVSLQSS